MPDFKGLHCPVNSSFYACTDPALSMFVGCCANNPCNDTVGCKDGDLRTATFDMDIWSKITDQSCERGKDEKEHSDRNMTWRTCRDEGPNRDRRFMGCCPWDPCGEQDCPQGMGAARLSSDEPNRTAFVQSLFPPEPGPKPTSAPEPDPKPTSAPWQSEESQKSDQGSAAISADVVAGIGIGCAAAGLLLGILAAFLLFRRRRQRHPQPKCVHMPYTPGKGHDVPAAPAAGDVQLCHFLLTPKPDNEITTELGSLGALIQQHVENNYHKQPVRQSAEPLAHALAALGLSGAGRGSQEALAQLALDPRTRLAALQHVITRVAFGSVRLPPPGTGSPGPAASLLPPAVAAFASSVPATERHRGNSEAVATAMTKWRQLSAFLLHPARSDRTPLTPPEEAIAQQAQKLATELDQFLQPFALRDSEHRKHLEQVLVECARFGYLLFSQPSEYRFDFHNHGQPAGIVVCPGLERVSDDEGRSYSTPEALAAPVEIA